MDPKINYDHNKILDIVKKTFGNNYSYAYNTNTLESFPYGLTEKDVVIAYSPDYYFLISVIPELEEKARLLAQQISHFFTGFGFLNYYFQFSSGCSKFQIEWNVNSLKDLMNYLN